MDLRAGFEDYGDDDENCRLIEMHPETFLSLTCCDDEQMREIMLESEDPFDYQKWADAPEPPFLTVDYRTGRVHGHEGRHRAARLIRAGIESMPVWIILFDQELIEQHVHGEMTLDELMEKIETYPMPEKYF